MAPSDGLVTEESPAGTSQTKSARSVGSDRAPVAPLKRLSNQRGDDRVSVVSEGNNHGDRARRRRLPLWTLVWALVHRSVHTGTYSHSIETSGNRTNKTVSEKMSE